MINLKELSKFLVTAKKATYASGEEAKKIIEKDKSTTLIFESGDWLYHDNYFGGEPYGGREVVFFKGEPVYIMTYYGWVESTVENVSEVYTTLQGALRLISEASPFRGPKNFSLDGFEYINNFEGEVNKFFGEEAIITAEGEKIYQAKYLGGLVDQR
jgi:hypothetical protein